MAQDGFLDIVNGTPYNWTLDNIHQTNTWGFPQSVNAFTTQTIHIEREDPGEVQYNIPGVGSFEIQARNNNGFSIQVVLQNFATQNSGQGSVVELGWNHDGNITFSISGTQGNLISSGATHANWMQQNLKTIGSRTLRHLCIPGSHDSGMSKLQHSTAFSTIHNTVTQVNSIANQLAVGVRFFDLRPVISSGQFYTGHYSLVDIAVYKGWQGGCGQSLDEIIQQLNQFTANNKELVILDISHSYDTDTGNNNYPPFTAQQYIQLFDKMSAIDNLYVAPSGANLVDLTLNQFIDNNRAAVVVVMEDGPSIPEPYNSKGFYAASQFAINNSYSDKNDVDQMAKIQFDNMKRVRTNPDAEYYLLSWNMTQQGLQNVYGESILSMATRANYHLYTQLMAHVNKQSYPNVIMIDKVENPDVAVLAMAINTLISN
ncbi:hypothetical protein AKO1_004201 [Acrasis kona]|uniref:PLC-like phosphodiesterase n=1 Tax=Acrasis kona TaxID=1008807 RepID=A0AAW2ZDJ8_9EUKA